MKLIRIVNLYFQKEYSLRFIEKFEEYKPQLLEQKGCLGVDLLKDYRDTGDFVTISKWIDEEHLENYRESALFKNMWANLKPHFRKQARALSSVEISK